MAFFPSLLNLAVADRTNSLVKVAIDSTLKNGAAGQD